MISSYRTDGLGITKSVGVGKESCMMKETLISLSKSSHPTKKLDKTSFIIKTLQNNVIPTFVVL